MAVRLNALAYYVEPVGRDSVDLLRFGVAPSFAWGVGTRYYYHEDQPSRLRLADRHVPRTGRPAARRRSVELYGLPQQDQEKVDLYRGTLTFDHKFNENIAVHNVFRYQSSQRDAQVTPPRILATSVNPNNPLGSIIVTRNRAGRDESESIIANQSEALFKFDAWRLKHKLVVGVDFARETLAGIADDRSRRVAAIGSESASRPFGALALHRPRRRNLTDASRRPVRVSSRVGAAAPDGLRSRAAPATDPTPEVIGDRLGPGDNGNRPTAIV